MSSLSICILSSQAIILTAHYLLPNYILCYLLDLIRVLAVDDNPISSLSHTYVFSVASLIKEYFLALLMGGKV